ncbi:glycosyltransferase [Microbacterium sp. EST19A]|uniref:glycosyltransferase n=1 Tax=Microbacterium sp. EST19A TaxID=2862681 RepID=UPI001CBACC22|nr:hypothetical protein [Microbacterium sp. EST19A]
MGRLQSVEARMLRGLQRAPRWVNGTVDFVVDTVVLRAAEAVRYRRFNATSAHAAVPPPVPVPAERQRVLVAPLNFAGQGNAWARAISSHVPGAGAVNLTIEYPGDLGFPTDRAVPHRVNRYSREWQVQESEHVVDSFTHVLVEAEAAIFGARFRKSPEKERDFFERHGLSPAYIAHGSDIRSPRRHREAEAFSPFLDDGSYFDRVQRRVDRNIRFLRNSGRQVFLSTPDLIEDYPDGTWVPVVVDVERWASGSEPPGGQGASSGVPRVLHTPSRLAVKGTHLIRETVTGLSEQRIIAYSEISGVPSSQIQAEVLRSDIVLDQFRLGSYGVAACEAMAAGKVVVGHVSERVRSFVLNETGLDLPIVEATPATIEVVLTGLVSDAGRLAEIGAAGQVFARHVHDGRMSAAALDRHWLRKP